MNFSLFQIEWQCFPEVALIHNRIVIVPVLELQYMLHQHLVQFSKRRFGFFKVLGRNSTVVRNIEQAR